MRFATQWEIRYVAKNLWLCDAMINNLRQSQLSVPWNVNPAHLLILEVALAPVHKGA